MKIVGILADFGYKKCQSEFLDLEVYSARTPYIESIELHDEDKNTLCFIIPYSYDKIEQYCDKIDGLLLTGGADVDPELYNEVVLFDNVKTNKVRFAFEIEFIKKFLKTKKPILGVCAGMQSINVALGGSLYQDIPEQLPLSKVKHYDFSGIKENRHDIDIVKNTLLHGVFNQEKISTNSIHHQAVKTLGDRLHASSFSEDGVIESLEMKPEDHPFCIGVQWHPELINEDKSSEALFKNFIARL